ncbi:unnamed protein product [Taenia asiatica]|uniref:Uncharacterized protein n=1 Tax=Taenia asiatica TaxID=60517 RepID=A0A0R3VZA9_TAEAS|nr:unnamed protein product [Taenia asiatica]
MEGRQRLRDTLEDPLRQPIHVNLSSLVRKSISTTSNHLQQSGATAAAVLKWTSQDDSAATSTSSSPATSVQLSSRLLARAARIFEMKL